MGLSKKSSSATGKQGRRADHAFTIMIEIGKDSEDSTKLSMKNIARVIKSTNDIPTA